MGDGSVRGEEARFAGFWVRAVSWLIDHLIMAPLLLILFVATRSFNGYYAGCALVALYFILLTGWKGQTVGKMAVGIMVVNSEGNVIGLFRAFLRYLGYVLDGVTLGTGFLIAGLTEEKTALHDMLCGTRVVFVHGQRRTGLAVAAALLALVITPFLLRESANIMLAKAGGISIKVSAPRSSVISPEALYSPGDSAASRFYKTMFFERNRCANYVQFEQFSRRYATADTAVQFEQLAKMPAVLKDSIFALARNGFFDPAELEIRGEQQQGDAITLTYGRRGVPSFAGTAVIVIENGQMKIQRDTLSQVGTAPEGQGGTSRVSMSIGGSRPIVQDQPVRSSPAPEAVASAPAPKAVDPAAIAQSEKFYQSGVKLYNRKNYADAVYDLNKAMELNPKNQKARKLFDRCLALLNAGD